jgi:glycosyltransferase involved in cell wall biosynthesis
MQEERLVSEKSSPFVSVIIPVYNDSERLKTCLKALNGQTYPRESYEIIVVDNGSDVPIGPDVAASGQVLVALETRPSSYAARNKGISLSRGEILAFADSDCIPAPDWIEKGVARLLSVPGCGLVGGRVQVFVQDPAHPTMVELYESVLGFQQENYITEQKFSGAGNLFTFRHVVEKVGGFNSSQLKSAGDVEWGWRVFSHGFKLVYGPDVRVAHPARHSLRQLHKRAVRIAGGLHDVRSKDRRWFLGLDKEILRGLLPPIHATAQALTDLRLRGPRQRLLVVFVAFFEKYSRVLERFRLMVGGSSTRK